MLDVETPPKKIIDFRVNSAHQSHDFELHRMWITAIPYEDGGHCGFYAVQEALIHFNQTAMTLEDRKVYERERKRKIELYKAKTGKSEELGAWLIISLNWLLPQLAKHKIIPKKCVCTRDTEKLVKDIGVIKQLETPVEVQKNDEYTDLEFPSLFFIERNNSTHVWFCPDEETFNKEEAENKSDEDNYVMMIPMEKAKDS